MSTPPSTLDHFSDYRAFLAQRHSELRDGIVADAAARVPSYTALPHEQLVAVCETLIGMLAEALARRDTTALIQTVGEALARRLREGISVEAVAQEPAIYRRHYLRHSVAAVAQGIAEAEGGLLFILDALDTIEQRMMAASRDRFAQLEILVSNALDGVLIYDTKGQISYVNQAFAGYIGVASPSALLERSIGSLIAPDEQWRVEAEINQGLRQSGGWQGQIWALREDGERWLAQISVFTLRQTTGKAIAFGAIIRNVTEISRAAQDRLRLLIDLERQTTELQRFQALVENAADGVLVASLDNHVLYANQAWNRLTGYGEEAIGLTSATFIAEDDHPKLRELAETVLRRGAWQGNLTYRRKDGNIFPALVTSFLIRDGSGEPQSRGVFVRDMSDIIEAQREREALQDQVISAQETAIRELSTPLIPLADGVVAMPLVGTISAARAQQIMEVLLEGIGRHNAEIALIDITGVRLIDTQIADALLRAAQAARLLGAYVVLTGIGAEVAQTLVGLGADLSGIVTQATLREGIAFALAKKDT